MAVSPGPTTYVTNTSYPLAVDYLGVQEIPHLTSPHPMLEIQSGLRHVLNFLMVWTDH